MFWKKKPKKEKKEKAPWERKAARAGLSKPTLIRKLDSVFSEFIRLRDSKEYGFEYFRCPTCGKVKPFEQADCAHYVKRSCMALRWSEMNCHIGCRYCNRYLDGNMLEYRKWMVKKYGEQQVGLLESRRFETKKWSLFELQVLIKHYEEEVKKLKDSL